MCFRYFFQNAGSQLCFRFFWCALMGWNIDQCLATFREQNPSFYWQLQHCFLKWLMLKIVCLHEVRPWIHPFTMARSIILSPPTCLTNCHNFFDCVYACFSFCPSLAVISRTLRLSHNIAVSFWQATLCTSTNRNPRHKGWGGGRERVAEWLPPFCSSASVLYSSWGPRFSPDDLG